MARPLIYRIHAADEVAGNKVGNGGAFGSNTIATMSGSSDPHTKTPVDWNLPSNECMERRQSESTTTVAPMATSPGLSRSLTWVRPRNHPSRVLKSVRSEWQPRWPEQARRALEGVPLSALGGGKGNTPTSEKDGEQSPPGGESSESPNAPNRYGLGINSFFGVMQEYFAFGGGTPRGRRCYLRMTLFSWSHTGGLLSEAVRPEEGHGSLRKTLFYGCEQGRPWLDSTASCFVG